MTELRELSRGTRPLSVFYGSGVFVGYAALFNRVDGAGDMVMPGAFARSLGKRGIRGIRMLFQHDPAEPIGSWLEIAEDQFGLKVRGRLIRGVSRAEEIAALLDQRGLDGLSIGFKAIDATRDRMTGVRRLTRLDLWEISIVTFPMQAGARVSWIERPSPAAAAGPPGAGRGILNSTARQGVK